MKALLERIWNGWVLTALLIAAYVAIEFYGFNQDMEDRQSQRITSEVAEKVTADLRAKSKARHAKLMHTLKTVDLTKPLPSNEGAGADAGQ